jgi:hypothetical protein
VPLELIKDVLEAGNWAPSAENGYQGGDFTVLTGRAKREYNVMFREILDIFIEDNVCRASGSAPNTHRIME